MPESLVAASRFILEGSLRDFHFVKEYGHEQLSFESQNVLLSTSNLRNFIGLLFVFLHTDKSKKVI